MNRRTFYLIIFLAMLLCLPAVAYANIGAPPVVSSLDWKGWVTIGILALTLFALITEIRPPDIILLIAGGLLVTFGILPPDMFLEGFSSDIIVTIAMLCIVVKAMEVHGAMFVVAKSILSATGSLSKQILSLSAPAAFMSAFVNNTPIVLLLSPVVRKWALDHALSPSKFLIPLAYATTLGGMCTIIGTSTNLVVEGILRTHASGVRLSFFELAYVGIPLVLIGIPYLMFAAHKLLPSRIDPATALYGQTREFTAEFVVMENCPLIKKQISELEGMFFKEGLLVQIERDHVIMYTPSLDTSIEVGDRLVFAGDINQIAALHAIDGLQSETDPQFKLDVTSSHFSEIVISTSSSFIGKTLKEINFRKRYGASVLAIYRQGKRIKGSTRAVILRPGDTLMLLSSDVWYGGERYTKDFYTIRLNEKLSIYNPWRAAFVLLTLVGIVITSTFGVPIVTSSIAAVLLLVFTKTITIRDAQNGIMWNLLLLIACSFALGNALQITGVAHLVAQGILSVVGTNPYMIVGGIVFVCMLASELLSNNATALIMLPIALHLGQLAGYESQSALKAIAIAVACGCSCCFALPTGYHTYMIVYGQGGYKFTDFLKVGLPLDCIILILTTFLIPILWPLQA